MRFRDLRGLTGLPVERVRARFREADIVTVLPVLADGDAGESILVATRRRLAVVSRQGTRAGTRLITRWASWDRVRLWGDDEGSGDDGVVYRLAISVGERTFHVLLRGSSGRAALRDFVIAAQSGR